MGVSMSGSVGGTSMQRPATPEARAGVERRRSKISRVAASTLAVAIVGSACTSGGEAPTEAARPPPGGTLRIGATWVILDPHVGYTHGPVVSLLAGWELLRCCLARTLLAYPGLSADEGGAVPVPDLATEQPEVSADGLTWTFRLRGGIRYAPPLGDVEVVAQDFVRALERAGDPDTSTDGYADFYSVVEGFAEFAEGRADRISGLEAPDEHTLVVRLTEPAGDLSARLALPAAAPIPPNPFDPDARLGVAEGHEFTYSRFLVSTGPYMFEGSEAVDLSAPADEREPPVGGDVARKVVLVRNPSWDPATDPLRAAIPDRIEIAIGFYSYDAPRGAADEEIEDLIVSGGLDLSFGVPSPAAAVERYRADPAIRDRVLLYPDGVIRYLDMNVAEPPFDDVHVRVAVNRALDKAELVRRYERTTGRTVAVARHVIPDGHLGNLLVDYDPYATPDARGDLSLARAAMARSRYDADGDGVCDDAACRRVLAVNAFPTPVARAVVERLAEIGIEVRFVPEVPGGTCFDRNVGRLHRAMCLGTGVIGDYPEPANYVPMLFEGRRIACAPPLNPGTCLNFSLLGATPDQLDRWGYEIGSVPSVDDRIARCVGEPDASRRSACWAELDVYLMEEVVPWVPLMVGTQGRVVSPRVELPVSMDEFGRLPALDRVSVTGEPAGPLPELVHVPASPLPPGEPGIPDGTYETTITRREALEAGLAPGRECVRRDEAVCIAGTYRLTVADGAWSTTSTAPGITCFAVPASVLELFGVEPPSGPVESVGREVRLGIPFAAEHCPGWGIVLRGSLVGDRLHLRYVWGQLGGGHAYDAVLFETHPWRKVA